MKPKFDFKKNGLKVPKPVARLIKRNTEEIKPKFSNSEGESNSLCTYRYHLNTLGILFAETESIYRR